ncbi:MAG: helix-turn-helix domain-containing protein [Nitrososphaerales archaeon]
MLLPAEIETRTSVPALRAMVAKRLLGEYDLSQKEAAEVMGVTQAAISNYLRGTRGSAFTIGNDSRIDTLIQEVAEMMVERRAPSSIISKFSQACTLIRTERLLCDIHKQLEPSIDVESCHVCDSENENQNLPIRLKLN